MQVKSLCSCPVHPAGLQAAVCRLIPVHEGGKVCTPIYARDRAPCCRPPPSDRSLDGDARVPCIGVVCQSAVLIDSPRDRRACHRARKRAHPSDHNGGGRAHMRARGGHATPVTIALRAGLAAAVRASPAAGLLGGADGEDIRSALARCLATACFLRIDANHPVVRATLGADIPPGALLRRCPSPPPPAAAGASGALLLPLPPPSPAAGLLLPLRHTKSVRQPAWAPAARHRPRRVHNRRRPAARPAQHLHPRRSNRCSALREERRRARPGPLAPALQHHQVVAVHHLVPPAPAEDGLDLGRFAPGDLPHRLGVIGG